MLGKIREDWRSYLSAINSREFLRGFLGLKGRLGDEGSLMAKLFFARTFVVIVNVMKILLG
jgi:hypothetical protein